jgi:hypothetical protein
MSQLTRFISKETKEFFDLRTPFHDLAEDRNGIATDADSSTPKFDPRAASKGLWG